MDWQRTILIGGMGLVAWMLVIQWNQFEDQNVALEQSYSESQTNYESSFDSVTISTGSASSDELPQLQSVPESSGLLDLALPTPNENFITAQNDVIEIVIDPIGGDIVSGLLLTHFDKKLEDGGQPFPILQNSRDNTYVARSGLIGPSGTDTAEGRPKFSIASTNFVLNDDQDTLTIDLALNDSGVRIVKRFTLSRNSYDIGVQYIINNGSSSDWNGTFYGQIKRDAKPPVTDVSGFSMQPFLGAALRQPEKNYAKFDFSDIEDESVKTSIEGGWVAMVQHYFITAWIPPADELNNFTLRKLSNQDMYLLSFTGAPISVPVGKSANYKASFYIGPKDQDALIGMAEYLDRTLDYGFLWILAEPIFKAMKMIHSVIGNWGWTIILLTLGIKLILYPLSAASLKSMAKMRNLQPQMLRLKELYGDDRQKMSQETMSLYKKEKVNPAGGCFPMLLQMPVFISLYWVLMESVEIRHAPWIFWIQDLSAKDPYFVLPIIMGASMLFMQKLQPAPTDPMQAKIMQIMPIAFTFLFMGFPSGLVLYWTVNNLLSMAQQWFVNRQLINNKN
ncbi:MAG: membrane protein insertase YidC [Porticoccaceae bacterium]|jgi:YidC/Oxa1 family membrane protein insertase|nr:membrane protein insertase YidC [Porticoccaceae bacterium]